MLTARGSAPARSRHNGTNRFHPLPIDAQFLGSEMMALRQCRQTWVKETIGVGSVSETKAAHNTMISGLRRLKGRREFLREITSCRTSLARPSRTSICGLSRQNSMIFLQFTEPHLSRQRCHRCARRRCHQLNSCTFHENLLVQRANELFDGEFEGSIGGHGGCTLNKSVA